MQQITIEQLPYAEDHNGRAIYPKAAEKSQMTKNTRLLKAPNQQVQVQVHQPDHSQLSHWCCEKNRIWHSLRQKENKHVRKAFS